MNLFSVAFSLFVTVLFILYYTVFRKKQWICLLLFSMAFYAYSGIANLIFMAITGFSVFAGGIWLMHFSEKYRFGGFLYCGQKRQGTKSPTPVHQARIRPPAD